MGLVIQIRDRGRPLHLLVCAILASGDIRLNFGGTIIANW